MEKELRRRRSIRLRGYDYAQPGAYFLTLCTHDRALVFGSVDAGEMRLSVLGHVVEEEWTNTAQLRPGIRLDAFVVMPNHFHGILEVATADPTAKLPPDHGKLRIGRSSGSLGSIVAGFKAAVTRRVRTIPNPYFGPLWQRNYHEHILRSEEALIRAREYIVANPGAWQEDPENPFRPGARPP